MNKFEFNQKIKKSSLNPSEKLVLLEILSFIENNKEFYGTNGHIAETFNFTERNVKAIISKLSKLGIIESEVKRKKHTNGDCNWFNKRYITIDFEKLNDFLNNDNQSKSIDIKQEIKEIKPIIIEEEIKPEMESNDVTPIDEPIEELTVDVDEYEIDDEQQEAWYNQIAGIKPPTVIEPIVSEVKPDKVTLNIENADEIKEKLSELLKAGKIDYNHKYRTQAYVKGSTSHYDIEDIIEVYLK